MILGENSRCFTPDIGGYVIVEKYSTIAKDCRFHAKDNHHCIENKKAVRTGLFGEMYSRGDIHIGNDVWIGEGVRILDGVTIDDGCIIGAGAVVASYIPPYSVVVGNPGRIIKYRFVPEIREKLLKIKWWNWTSDIITERDRDFEDIDTFIEKYYEK
jgi:virginiamycin A acetyltransferase